MSHELKEGTKLRRVTGQPDPDEGTMFWVVNGEGPAGVKDITVTEQPGQMAMVPWARIECHDGDVFLVNLANVEIVELAAQEGES
jgi:hypothetical protein